MSADITLSDYLAISNVAFEWCQGYDQKDWERLRSALAPAVRLDYRSIGGVLHENLTPDEYVAILSAPKLLGDKRVKTQHLLGSAQYDVRNSDSAWVSYQARVAHQRYEDDTFASVKNRGHGYGLIKHRYRKIEGQWKIEGMEARLDWTEYDMYGTLDPGEDLPN